MTMNEPDLKEKIGEGMWNEQNNTLRRVLGSRNLEHDDAT
jgi:hypothetical protein